MANAITTPIPQITAPIQFSHQIHTTLDNDNFLLWKSQILPVLRGHGLDQFLDESHIAPERFLLDANGVQVINPAYLKWHQEDQLILAWIFSSISSPLLAQVIRCETAASVWSALNRIHASQSMAKILDLKLQLQTMKKGSASCAQFLQQIQSLADRLRSIGTDIPDHELVLYTLQGLGTDYENFVTAISLRSMPPTTLELNNLLLTHEARLLTNLRSMSSTAVHLTAAVSSDSNSSPSANYVQNSDSRYNNQASNNTYRGRGSRGRNNYRGRGRGRQTSSSQDSVQCQICTKWGHSALDCYHRFNIKYAGPPTVPIHPPQALMAEPAAINPTASIVNSNPWYIDSGA